MKNFPVHYVTSFHIIIFFIHHHSIYLLYLFDHIIYSSKNPYCNLVSRPQFQLDVQKNIKKCGGDEMSLGRARKTWGVWKMTWSCLGCSLNGQCSRMYGGTSYLMGQLSIHSLAWNGWDVLKINGNDDKDPSHACYHVIQWAISIQC